MSNFHPLEIVGRGNDQCKSRLIVLYSPRLVAVGRAPSVNYSPKVRPLSRQDANRRVTIATDPGNVSHRRLEAN